MAGWRRRDSLVLAGIYFELVSVDRETKDGDTEVSASDLLTIHFEALIAAEVEFHGPLRLSYTQNAQLAEVYERVGMWFQMQYKLHEHAALAFRRAATLHYQNEDSADQERCELNLARAKCGTVPLMARVGMYTVDLLCGYGYRPFRMIPWMLILVGTFGTYLFVLDPTLDVLTAYSMSAMNFFNPLGPGDTAELNSAARTMMGIESLVGTLFVFFFAILSSRRIGRIGRRQ